VSTYNDFCSVKATQDWTEERKYHFWGIVPLARSPGNEKERFSDKSIALIVKKYIGEIGMNVNVFAAHNLNQIINKCSNVGNDQDCNYETNWT
jgi:hypothetical protein